MNIILAIYSLAVAGLAVFGLHRLTLLIASSRRRAAPLPRLDDEALPFVTVQLPVYNERYVAARVVLAAARMDYPRELLQIQILDDSTDDTRELLSRLTRRLRRIGIQVDHIHRTHRTGFKAGALQEGLDAACGDLLAIFDADFVPPRAFLREALAPFRDPRVGMVQTRWGHLNRETSLLTRLEAIFLDGHFQIEQVARNATGKWFNFNGTAGIWRRRAILDAGGWTADTLTEDLDLSYRAQLAGWDFEYLPGLVSPAELPGTMNAFKTQQHRWAKGSIQTARKLLPEIVCSKASMSTKIESVFHLLNNLTYLIMMIPVLLWVPTLSVRFDPDRKLMVMLAVAMGLTTLWAVSYHLVCQLRCGRKTRAVLPEIPALLALGIGLSVNNARAVIEALAGQRSGFERTPKHGTEGLARQRFRYNLRPHWLSWIELGFAAYFGVGFAMAIHNERWIALPFLALFLIGFLYVGLGSFGWRTDRMLLRGTQGALAGLLCIVLWSAGAHGWAVW